MREAGGLIAAGLLRCKNRNVPMGCFDVPARRPAAAQGAGMHLRNSQLTRPVGRSLCLTAALEAGPMAAGR